MMWMPGIVLIGYRQILQVFVKDRSQYPEELHPYVEVGDYPTGNTGSELALSKVKPWMERCREEHAECQQGRSNDMPTRIFFIEDPLKPKVRLIENPPIQPYICLSHRWMDVTRGSKLLRNNGSEFQEEVPPDLFYPLLRNAVEATYRLGFQYLWVDCLCIYQDPDDDD